MNYCKMREIRPVYMAMFLFSATLALYYPSILEIFFNPGVFSIDDANLMDFILNHELQLREVLNPAGSGKYFRPLLLLSFLIDQRLWGADAFGFRVTNMFIHTLNVVLMYLTVRLMLKNHERSEWISAISALIFGIHPLAVESVAWISGRTDPLATMWGLLALLLYLSARLKNRWYLLPFSLFCIFASVMSKEVGFAIPVIIAVWEIVYSRMYWNVPQGKQIIIFILSIAVIPVYFLLRSSFFNVKDMSLGFIKSGISSDITSSTLAFFASFGFYTKKFLYPLPLEFVIESININIYAVVGLIVGLSLPAMLLISSLRKYSFFFLWALLGIGPAALVSFTDIAWTKWAERYLYFSLVPLSVISATAYFDLTDRLSLKHKRIASIIAISLLLSFSLTTFNRSRLWNDSLGFWSDAYVKSPDSINVSVAYANSLIQEKREAEGENVLLKALGLKEPKHQVMCTLAVICAKRGDLDMAEEYYKDALSEARADKRFVLEGARFKSRILISIGQLKLAGAERAEDSDHKRALFMEGLDYFDKAYMENRGDTFLLYRIAKGYMSIGEKEKAIAYFKRYATVSGDSIYRQTAEKLIRKLE